jgi:hypothetical protein
MTSDTRCTLTRNNLALVVHSRGGGIVTGATRAALRQAQSIFFVEGFRLS